MSDMKRRKNSHFIRRGCIFLLPVLDICLLLSGCSTRKQTKPEQSRESGSTQVSEAAGAESEEPAAQDSSGSDEKQEDGYALLKRMIETMDYNYFHYANENLVIVGKKTGTGSSSAKYGAIDAKGNIIIPVEYDSAIDKGEGFYNFGKAVPDQKTEPGGYPDLEYYLFDEKGQQVLDESFSWIGEMKNGVCTVYRDRTDAYEAGLIDRDGNFLIPFGRFSAIGVYEGELAPACYQENEEQISVLIDRKGNVKTPPYDYISDFSEGMFAASKYRSDGSMVCGYLNSQGREAIPFQYVYTGDFCHGVAPVQIENPEGVHRYGGIGTDGRIIIPFDYDWISGFENGAAIIGVAQDLDNFTLKMGYITPQGESISRPIYDSAMQFEGRLAVVGILGADTQDYYFGAIDRDGNMVIPPRYTFLSGFETGVSAYSLTDSSGEDVPEADMGYINDEGKVLTEPRYYITYDYDGYFAEGILKKDGKLTHEYIDRDGNVIIPFNREPIYDNAFYDSE